MTDFSKLSLIVVTHEFFKGTAQELKDFLNKHKAVTLLYIAHKFFYSPDKFSYYEIYKSGNLSSAGRSVEINVGENTGYIKDFLYTAWAFVRNFGRYDYYVGSGAFNVVFGLILKRLGLCKKVVFITIDYVMENRFKSKLLNYFYIRLDRAAFFGADYTWNVSERIAKQRILELGDKVSNKPQITVPIGVPLEEAVVIEALKKGDIVVYSGGLTPGFGLELVVEAMPELVKLFPTIELRIIGKGPVEAYLKSRAKSLGVESNVNFVGYMDTNKERERWLRLIKESTVGLAIYQETPETAYKRFSDVTKPKDYMACGLPIIASPLIPLSEDIKQYNLGRVVEYNNVSVVNGVKEILGNKEERLKIEENVYKYSKDKTWENIFTKAFTESGF